VFPIRNFLTNTKPVVYCDMSINVLQSDLGRKPLFKELAIGVFFVDTKYGLSFKVTHHDLDALQYFNAVSLFCNHAYMYDENSPVNLVTVILVPNS